MSQKLKVKSSKLTEADVAHVAKLAKLALTDAEVKKFQQQLSAILDYIGVLNEVDTTNIEPTSRVTGLQNVTREDEIKDSLTQEQALSNTKSKQNGYFKIRAIFE